MYGMSSIQDQLNRLFPLEDVDCFRRTQTYLRTYHIGDYVNIKVNRAIREDVPARILDMFNSQYGASLLVHVRYLHHTCVRLSCFCWKPKSCGNSNFLCW
ncbi:hypothetical protein MTR_5g073870 [Medicago truncatula]|uniref:Uncharacterized protein n=1 Tax=Medicago truncatula TaxID=3880 RepID=G7K5P5_MEDTR|nr:hypothetical protein MTR_5g073870 [Medicago truncatula]